MVFAYLQLSAIVIFFCAIANGLQKKTHFNGFIWSIITVSLFAMYRIYIEAPSPGGVPYRFGFEVGVALWPLLLLTFCEITRRYYQSKVRIEQAKTQAETAKVAAEHSLRLSQLRESDLRLQAEKQKSLVEMGQLAAGLNHEIGNAIDPIGYQIEDLSKEKIEHPAVQKALPLMRERMGAVERLLDALRDVSRPIQLKPERINLPRFLNSVLLDAKDLPQSKGVEFAAPVADPALACNADEPWLRRVLFNLLRNAAEACQGRPGPRVALEALVLDGFIKIEVKDSPQSLQMA